MKYYQSYSGMIFFREDDIRHHGILGQRWGKRNGPPYPLGYNAHSAAEKKLNSKKRISAGDDSSKVKKSTKPSVASKAPSSSKEGNKKPKASQNVNNKKDILAAEKRNTGDSIIGLSHDDFNAALLKKNPNAAVVNPNILDWAKAHKKELAIGAGVALGVAIAAGVVYYKKKSGARIPIDNAIPMPPVIKNGKEKCKAVLANASAVFSGDYKLDRNTVLKESGNLSPQNRFIKQWLAADIHRYDAITQAAYDAMDNTPVNIPAGGKMYRMSKKMHDSLRDGIEYVSINEEDRKRYIGFLPQMWSANGGSRNAYFELALSANNNIKAPGKKETIDIVEAVLKKMGFDDRTAHNTALKDFYQYQANLIDRHSSFNEEFFKELMSRGYNACVDFNDAGRLSDKPLILINASKNASVDGINKWTKEEAYKLFENINLPEAAKSFTNDDFLKAIKDHPFGQAYAYAVNTYTKRH